MLIPSTRHRPEDLRRWAELEEGDVVRGQSARLGGSIARSIAEIRAFAAAGSFYVSVSGGKDSAVMVALVRMAGVPARMVHVRAGRFANPDTAAVIAMLGSVEIIDIEYEGNDEAHGDRQFFAALRGAGSRYMSGIRADESSGRRLRMRRHGMSTGNTCAPLGWWNAADVFAFAATHATPLHPAYAMLGGGRWPRERLRVDELGGDRGSHAGRSEWEREYYGDVLNQIAASNR